MLGGNRKGQAGECIYNHKRLKAYDGEERLVRWKGYGWGLESKSHRMYLCSLSPGAQHAPSIAIPYLSLVRLESEGQQVNEYLT